MVDFLIIVSAPGPGLPRFVYVRPGRGILSTVNLQYQIVLTQVRNSGFLLTDFAKSSENLMFSLDRVDTELEEI